MDGPLADVADRHFEKLFAKIPWAGARRAKLEGAGSSACSFGVTGQMGFLFVKGEVNE